jgi:cell division septum initiation protein DivIVA
MDSSNEYELLPLKTGFDRVWRGWQPSQVRAYLDRVEADVQMLVTDRDAAGLQVDDLRKQLAELRGQFTELRRDWDRVCWQPLDPEGLDHRLRRKVELAELAAEEILNGARTAAERRWQETVRAADRLEAAHQNLIEQAQKRRYEAEDAYQTASARAQTDVEEMTRRAEAERARLEEEAEHRRQQSERRFEVEWQERQAEADRRLAEREALSQEKARRIVERAAEEAKDVVARAQERADALQQLRYDFASHLESARELLGRVEPLMREGEPTVRAQSVRPEKPGNKPNSERRATIDVPGGSGAPGKAE